MIPEVHFLKALKDKLKGGHTGSIHLNALPGRYATRLDLSQLNHARPGSARDLLHKLLHEPAFLFRISFEGIPVEGLSDEHRRDLGLLAKRLNALYIENEDNFKEHGIKTLALGYPLLMLRSPRDPARVIKAPVFIWRLELLKSFREVNTWTLLRNKVVADDGRIRTEDVHPVLLNEVLVSFIKAEFGIDLPELRDDAADETTLGRDEVLRILLDLLRRLGLDTEGNLEAALESQLDSELYPIPDKTFIDTETASTPWVYFGGVVGLYRTPKETIISDLEKLLERKNTPKEDLLIVEKFSGSSKASVVETDPSQQEILNSLNEFPRQIIQGPPGTGKSQSLTALITNALANQLKCLVVCEKKTALDVIHHNLSRISPLLGELAVVIEDMNADRDAVVNSVRERASRQAVPQTFNEAEHDYLDTAYHDAAESVNRSHRLLSRPVFQGRTWTDTVGLLLQKQKTASPDLLKGRLDFGRFEYNDTEFEAMTDAIRRGQPLFAAVPPQSFLLGKLHDSVFRREPALAAQAELEQALADWRTRLQNLINEINECTLDYATFLSEQARLFQQRVLEEASDFIGFWNENIRLYGSDFAGKDDVTELKVSVLGVFSGKYKQIRENKRQLLERYARIRNLLTEQPWFRHNFIVGEEAGDLFRFAANIDELNKANLAWYAAFEQEKQALISNFSEAGAHRSYAAHLDKVRQTGQRARELLQALARQELFADTSQREPANFWECKQTAQYFINEVDAIGQQMPGFRPYYDWRRFFQSLSPLQQLVLRAVSTLEGDWLAPFESWYIKWLLAVREDETLPRSEQPFAQLFDKRNALRRSQFQKIVHYWSRRQAQSTKELAARGVSIAGLYNKRGSKGERRHSLRRIVSTSFDLFTDYFPVLLVNPSVCSSMLPLEPGLFDVVIFDEASQLRLEDTFAALYRGRYSIVSGDSQQMPPSSYFQGGNALLAPGDDDDEPTDDLQEGAVRRSDQRELAQSESLLEYAERSNYKQSYLKIHYRSRHPYLIDFSNHAFYGKRLLPMPSREDYLPIRFVETGGVYDNQVNPTEAARVIDILLHEIRPDADGNMPSVGVATFNIYQRNLIIEEISRLRQDPELDRHFSRLGQDFFVKNLENIQGDERDIIILSTTFGYRPDGSFRQLFGPLLQQNGYKLLNVIITRAKRMVYVCTSVPAAYYNTYDQLLDAQGNTGKAVFYAYLAYAKAVSNGEAEVRQAILDKLFQRSGIPPQMDVSLLLGAESVFEEEVLTDLGRHLPGRLVPQYRLGGFRIDIVVLSALNGKPMVAIECDGAKYHSSEEAYAWDMFRQQHLESYGLVFHRIWSTNWWQQPEAELQKLLAFVEELDEMERQAVLAGKPVEADAEPADPRAGRLPDETSENASGESVGQVG